MPGFGYFGKLPSRGDFVRSNLPTGFVSVWDTWLQTRIAGSRADMGPLWQDAYMRAPIWRFTLAAGIAGADTVIGVLMPSVDRVGREYPLTLAAPVGDAPPGVLHLSAEEEFARLEAAALAALDDAATPDTLAEAVGAIDPPSLTTARSGGTGIGATTALALEATADRAGTSIWSALSERGILCLIADGLPDARLFRRLLEPPAMDPAGPDRSRTASRDERPVEGIR